METEANFSCVFCGCTEGAALFTSDAQRDRKRVWCKCAACGTICPAPVPTTDELTAAYSAQYYGAKEHKFISPVEWVIGAFRGRRARFVQSETGAAARILEIGCGSGDLLARCSELGMDVFGTEMPGPAADRAQRKLGGRLHSGPLEQAGYPSSHFDAVILWHVFEHLTDPQAYLKIITDILKPGGKLIIAVPNIDSLQAQWFKGHWLHLDPPRHLFLQGPLDLDRCLSGYGFTRTAISFYQAEQNIFGWIQSWLNQLFPSRDFFYECLKGNQRMQGPVILRAFGHLIAAVILAPAASIAAIIESAIGRGGAYTAIYKKSV